MMKKRILKVIGLLGVCGILEITTPAVTFAETSTTDTSGMSDEEVYEKALDYAKKVYKYDKAAELLRTIEGYKDSTELADRYEVMNTNRFIGGRFYWYPEEYALMLKQNIKSLGAEYEAEVTDEQTDEDGSTIDTITFTNNKETATAKLYDVREDGSFSKCEISTTSGSMLAYPAMAAMATARSDADTNTASDIIKKLVDMNPHGSDTRDGLTCTFDNDGLYMTFTIEPDEEHKQLDTAASAPAETTETQTNESDTESSSNNTTANDSLYEEAVDQLQLILDKVNDPSGLTINKAEYAENTYLGEKIFMFDCSYTNEVGGIGRTKFACIDGTLYDEDPARPQGNMAYIQFWDKEDSTKLDAKKLMDMIK